MNPTQPDFHDEALRRLLREADPSASLPPRFRQSVWSRIEAARRDAPANSGWLESVVALLLRPAFAATGLMVLMLVGGFLGVQSGQERAREEAQVRYVASVNPLSRVSAP